MFTAALMTAQPGGAPRMNYITLINHFWAKDLEHSFTPNDIAVYFRLLERCNALGWKNPFNFSVDELLAKLRLKTKAPLDTSRNRLKQAGLIDFKNGDGRGQTTRYWLIVPDDETGDERGKKNTPLSPTLSPTLLSTLSTPEEPLLHKTKTKTKKVVVQETPPPPPMIEKLISPEVNSSPPTSPLPSTNRGGARASAQLMPFTASKYASELGFAELATNLGYPQAFAPHYLARMKNKAGDRPDRDDAGWRNYVQSWLDKDNEKSALVTSAPRVTTPAGKSSSAPFTKRSWD